MLQQAELGLRSSAYDRLRTMASIDLHRHLSGSVRFETLHELALRSNLPNISSDFEQFSASMSVQKRVSSLASFVSPRNALRPWHLLHNVMTSREIAFRIAYEALEDAAAEGVGYAEFRCSPYGLMDTSPLPLGEFLSGLRDGFTTAERQFATTGVIVISLIRHTLAKMAPRTREEYYDRLLAITDQFRDRVVGFDLAGTERAAPPDIFREFFLKVKACGYGVTIHAGEGEPASNIRDAVELLGAERIGHGVSLLNDRSTLELVRSRQVTVEQCLTSNVITRAVANLSAHPMAQLLDLGVRVALCTDNPSMLGVRLVEEYESAYQNLGIREDQLALVQQYSREASFAQRLKEIQAH